MPFKPFMSCSACARPSRLLYDRRADGVGSHDCKHPSLEALIDRTIVPPSERSPKRESTTSIPLVPIRRERRPLCHHPNDPESSGWATDPIAIKDASLEAELNDKALR
ncbi:MAG: hypothetical protein EVB08_06660 [Synechococcus sp. MED-G135]|nr:MAG: hypothetical protein EVB08_06660 [Synechococcus sp. MED-G135]